MIILWGIKNSIARQLSKTLWIDVDALDKSVNVYKQTSHCFRYIFWRGIISNES